MAKQKTPKSFGVVWHVRREKWIVQLRDRTEARRVVYVGFAKHHADAVIMRNVKLWNDFGEGGLALAWELLASRRKGSGKGKGKDIV